MARGLVVLRRWLNCATFPGTCNARISGGCYTVQWLFQVSEIVANRTRGILLHATLHWNEKTCVANRQGNPLYCEILQQRRGILRQQKFNATASTVRAAFAHDELSISWNFRVRVKKNYRISPVVCEHLSPRPSPEDSLTKPNLEYRGDSETMIVGFHFRPKEWSISYSPCSPHQKRRHIVWRTWRWLCYQFSQPYL